MHFYASDLDNACVSFTESCKCRSWKKLPKVCNKISKKPFMDTGRLKKCSLLTSSPMWCVLCCSINRIKLFIEENHTNTHSSNNRYTQSQTLKHTDTYMDSLGQEGFRCTTQYRSQQWVWSREFNLDSPLVKQLHEVLFFLSLMWQCCIIGNSELITNML